MYFCAKVQDLRYFITFSYDGTQFSGMQIQPNAPTIQEELENALSQLLDEEIRIIAAGRTDAGVSAKKMVAHFDTDKNTENLTYRLNRYLPKTIAVQYIQEVNPEAHARFDALSRTYQYHLHFLKNPFLDAFSYQYPYTLNIKEMNDAAHYLLEVNDFSSFEKMHSDNKTSICNVSHAQWKIEKDQWIFTITADRFLRNMVRAIVGTLWEVGKGEVSFEEFKTIVAQQNRCFAGASAPANALFLTDIQYPSNLFYV